MKKLLLLVSAFCMGTVTLCAMHQNQFVAPVKKGQREMLVNQNMMSPKWIPSAIAKASESEGTCFVTCNVPDNQDWTPYDVVALDNEHHSYVGMGSGVEVPEGTYTFVAYFIHNSADSYTGTDYVGFVVHENVEVTSDMQLTFDPATATNHLHFTPKLKDGSDLLLKKVNYDEYFEGSVIREANFDCMDLTACFAIGTENWNYKGSTTYTTAEIQITPWGNYDPTYSFDLYINDVSDEVSVGMTAIMVCDKSNTHIIAAEQKGCSSGNLVNDYLNYIDRSLEADFTPKGAATPDIIEENNLWVTPYGLRFSLVGGYTNANPMTFTLTKNDKSIYNVSYSNSGKEVTFNNILIAPVVTEVYEKNYSFYGMNNLGSYKMFSGNKQIDHCTYIDNCLSTSYSLVSPHIYTLPGHELYISTADNCLDKDFTTSPALVCVMAESYDSYDDKFYPTIPFAFIGRNSETRFTDKCYMELEAKNDGRTIATYYADLDEWFYDNPDYSGLLEISITNRNCVIDGQEVVNTALIKTDLSNEDHFAPSLTMLQFRDEQGCITSSFEKGELRLSATDINYDRGTCTFASANPLSVKCECASAGSDNYRDIELIPFMSETEDAVLKANFTAVMSSDNASNGWNDLRITITDLAGNSQMQTINRAFCLSGATGIDIIKDSDAQSEYFDLMGRKINKPSTGLYVEKSAKGTRVVKF